MKRLMIFLVAAMMVFTACGTTQPQEGVTLTREKYDELMAENDQLKALVAENDQLKKEIEYLEQRLDDYTLKEQGASSDSKNAGSDSDGNGSADDTATPTETTEAPANDLSPSEIEQLTLSPFVGEFGLYGYKDESGNVIIEADFDSATAFQNNQATVTRGGKSGVLTRSGLVTWTKTETYKSAKVEPANDLVEGSDFAAFIKEFRAALESRNEAKVREHLHENIKISFGGHAGWDDLVSYWSIDEGSEAFYRVLNAQIRFGVVDTSGGEGVTYAAPYMFANFPVDMDPFRDIVCIGQNVNVRTRPTTESEVITQLTYDVVRAIGGNQDGWFKIQLPDGERGFVSASYMESPLYYRAIFEKVDGKWMVMSFVKGD